MSFRQRVSSITGRARGLARIARDLFPLTLPGLVTLAAAGVALWYYGLRRVDLLLLVVGAVGLALGGLALVLVLLAALVLRLSARRGAEGPELLRLECGVPAETGFSLPRLWYLPGVKVAWSWVDPAASVRPRREGGRLREVIVPERRFFGDAVVRRIEVGDAFGLTRIAFRAREARKVRLYPATLALGQVHVIKSVAGGDDFHDPKGPADGERIDMRAYEAGDPIRLVLWKVFARSRELMVRMPERAYSVSKRTLAYVVAGEGDEPAAAAARVAVESGALGASWVLGVDGSEADASGRGEALDLLARSATARPEQQGAGLGGFLKRVAKAPGERAVIFVPARPGPWVARVLAAAKARGAPVEFVVCTDGVDRGEKRSVIARIALAAPKASGPARTPAAELAKVTAALGAARTRVTVVDRLSGRVFSEAQGRALAAPAQAKVAVEGAAS